MRFRNLIIAAAALMISSCSEDGASQGTASRCALDVEKAPDGTVALKGDCPRDAKGVAAALDRAPGTLGPADEIALGRTPLNQAGLFDRCRVMARLAEDPRWNATIDSNTASAPLRDALRADVLSPPVAAALSGTGHKLRGVSLEKILLGDGPAEGCPRSPAKAPIEAQIWLSLK